MCECVCVGGERYSNQHLSKDVTCGLKSEVAATKGAQERISGKG